MPILGWSSSVTLTIDNTAGGALTNVQVPVQLNVNNFAFATAKSDGTDLRFLDSDNTTQLNFWRQQYDSTGKTAALWVKAPSISAGSKKTIFLNFGNAGASDASSYDNTMQKIAADASTLALFHFDEGTGTTSADAVGTYAATLVATPTWAGTDGGNFGRSNSTQSFASGSAISLNGTSQYVTFGTLLQSPPASGEIALWLRFDAALSATNDNRIFTVYSNDSRDAAYNALDCYVDHATGKIHSQKTNAGVDVNLNSTFIPTVNRWYHLRVSWGTGGFCLYIDGVCLARSTDTAAWGNGTRNSMAVGCYNADGPVQLFSKITFDELVVRNTVDRERANADFTRRKFIPSVSQYSRLVPVAGPIITPTLTSESTAVIEPRFVVDVANSLFRLVYAGGWASPALHLATCPIASDPAVAANWTKLGKIIGQGTSGVAGSACRGFVYFESGTWYIYFSNGTGSVGDVVKVATTTDWVTYTVQSAAAATPPGAPGFDRLANSCVVKNGASYLMLVEGKGATGVANWQLAPATATSPLGPFTVSASVLTSLELTNDTNGSCSGPSLQQIGSQWGLWYHAAENSDLPTTIYYATAVGPAANNWQQYPYNSVIDITQPSFEFDQVADANVTEYNGKTYLWHDGDKNPSQAASIGVATYAGTRAQLIADSPSISASVSQSLLLRRRKQLLGA